MMLVTENDMHDVLAVLSDETGAAARATHEYLDDLSKVVLAKLTKESNATSAGAKEAEARSRPEYMRHLEEVRAAADLDYRWRQRYAAANAKMEVWRTQNANARAAERVR
jgi:hypothetical protein